MKSIFLDTNVIIDFLGEREPFYISSAKVVTLADKKKIKLLISPISITTVHYILSKYESPASALEKIRKFKIISEISIVNEIVIDKAINSNFKDFEDAVQYFSAIESKCDVLLTRNEKDFKNAMVPVMDAEAFLKSINIK